MEMTLRWYGSKFDTVTLQQIRQIPGVTGVITTLYDTAPGEVWSRERIRAMKDEVAAAGLHIAGIESVNVHDAIKTGSADRDRYIDNYIETLRNLGEEEVAAKMESLRKAKAEQEKRLNARKTPRRPLPNRSIQKE